MFVSLFLFAFCGASVIARPERLDLDEDLFHPDINFRALKHGINDYRAEDTPEFWVDNAQETLLKKLKSKPIEGFAKNVILFLGDGMSVPTQTATRVYYGGEEQELSFEKFPYSGLSKTYCVNTQTADSGCSATAYLGGVKGNIATIGVTAAVQYNDCEAMLLEENQVESIAKWSQDAGKRTGIVTTSTVVDASPAGAFAKIANRWWQTDEYVEESGWNATKCRDITYQLVKWAPGKNFNIILGGGSGRFLDQSIMNEFDKNGDRTDGLNLIEEWISDRTAEGKHAQYVWNRSELLTLDEETDHVLGLFSNDYMPFNLERDASLTPSLAEMTEAAIKIASKGNGAKNGYFLFIEGGRIDHGHHATIAKRAFDETVEFSKAIEKALEMTTKKDTLIVVTADHAHTMSLSGYPQRGNPILGAAGTDDYGQTRLTINYANGPKPVNSSHNYGDDDTTDDNYQFPAVSYLQYETHGADDVGIYAKGPWAHLLSGVVEQNFIPHAMAYASCVGDGVTACDYTKRPSKHTKHFDMENEV